MPIEERTCRPQGVASPGQALNILYFDNSSGTSAIYAEEVVGTPNLWLGWSYQCPIGTHAARTKAGRPQKKNSCRDGSGLPGEEIQLRKVRSEKRKRRWRRQSREELEITRSWVPHRLCLFEESCRSCGDGSRASKGQCFTRSNTRRAKRC